MSFYTSARGAGYGNIYSHASRNAPLVLGKDLGPSHPARGAFPASLATNPQELKFATEVACTTDADPEMFALHQRMNRLESSK